MIFGVDTVVTCISKVVLMNQCTKAGIVMAAFFYTERICAHEMVNLAIKLMYHVNTKL